MQFSTWNLEAISRGSFVVRSGEKAGATVRQRCGGCAGAQGGTPAQFSVLNGKTAQKFRNRTIFPGFQTVSFIFICFFFLVFTVVETHGSFLTVHLQSEAVLLLLGLLPVIVFFYPWGCRWNGFYSPRSFLKGIAQLKERQNPPPSGGRRHRSGDTFSPWPRRAAVPFRSLPIFILYLLILDYSTPPPFKLSIAPLFLIKIVRFFPRRPPPPEWLLLYHVLPPANRLPIHSAPSFSPP